jgi:hypothetical protein
VGFGLERSAADRCSRLGGEGDVLAICRGDSGQAQVSRTGGGLVVFVGSSGDSGGAFALSRLLMVTYGKVSPLAVRV